jgi:hypothetical protein
LIFFIVSFDEKNGRNPELSWTELIGKEAKKPLPPRAQPSSFRFFGGPIQFFLPPAEKT